MNYQNKQLTQKELLRQQNEELKNKLLAMRCEAHRIAQDLRAMDGSIRIIERLQKLAE